MTRTLTLAATLAMTSGALGAPPAKFFDDSTFMTMQINLAQITVDNAKAAVNALIKQEDFDSAGIPVNIETDIMPQVGQIGMMQMMTMSFIQNGASKVLVTMRAPGGDMNAEPNVNILMPANSEQGAQQMLSFAQGMGAQAGLGATLETIGDQHWVVMTPPGSTTPMGDGSPAIASTFDSALSAAGDNTVTFAMVPSEQMVSQMLENVADPQGKEMMKLVMQADWMSGWLSLDGTPELGVTMHYPNAELAQQVAQAYAGALAFMQQQAKDADAQMGEDAPAEFRPSKIASDLSSWLAMERDGNTCTIRLDPQELRSLSVLAIKAGPALADNPIFGEMMRQMESNMGPGF